MGEELTQEEARVEAIRRFQDLIDEARARGLGAGLSTVRELEELRDLFIVATEKDGAPWPSIASEKAE